MENKETAAILQAAVCIGDTNAINLELFLAPEYYQATMERYEEIRKFNMLIHIHE